MNCKLGRVMSYSGRWSRFTDLRRASPALSRVGRTGAQS